MKISTNTSISPRVRVFDRGADYVSKEEFLKQAGLLNSKYRLWCDMESFEDPEAITPDKIELFTDDNAVGAIKK